MACRNCGDPEVQDNFLCDKCIEENLAKGRERRTGFIYEDELKSNPVLTVLDNQHFQVMALLIGTSALFLCAYFFNPFQQEDTTISLLFASSVSMFALSFIIWIIFMVRMFAYDPMWGIACIFIPGLVYRYVIINFHEVKYLFFLHVVTGIATIILVVMLKRQLINLVFGSLNGF